MNKEKFNMGDFAQDQLVAISKAGAYDAIAEDYRKAKNQNEALKKSLNDVLDLIKNTDSAEIVNSPNLIIIKIGETCLDALKNNL